MAPVALVTETALDLTKTQEYFIGLTWDKKLSWAAINERSIDEYLPEIKAAMERDAEWLPKLKAVVKDHASVQQQFRGLLGEHLIFRSKLVDEYTRLDAYTSILPLTGEGYAAWRIFFEKAVKEGKFATAAYYTKTYLTRLEGSALEGKVRLDLARFYSPPALNTLKAYLANSATVEISTEELDFEKGLSTGNVVSKDDLLTLPSGSWKERRLLWQALFNYYLTRDKLLEGIESFPLQSDNAERVQTLKEQYQIIATNA